jgi:hypothetical protein
MKLPLRGMPEVPSGWGSLLLLAQTMRKELASIEVDPNKVTDKMLKEEIYKQLHGGAMPLDAELSGSTANLWQELGSWFAREKWWILLLATSGSLMSLNLLSMIALVIFCFITFGVLFAMVVGSSMRSRFFIISIWTVLGLIVASTPLVSY